MTATHHVLIGDCRESMRSLPAGSVHCVVTSPPYWALRDYGVDGQLGLENTPEEYVAGMVDVFREVWRVLRDDGTLWLNIGDSYNNAGSSRNGEGLDGTRRGGATGPDGQCGYKQRDLRHALKDHGIKHKDLVGIPWRLAFALQAAGWYLRQDIIWHKPSPMPESVRDRCTKAHEYIFLLTKRPRYFFDAEAVKENGRGRETFGNIRSKGFCEQRNDNTNRNMMLTQNRNRRSVWTITSESFKGAHFATFPTKLVEPCLLAGTSAAGCCAECGGPWVRIKQPTEETAAAQAAARNGQDWTVRAFDNSHKRPPGRKTGDKSASGYCSEYKTTGWQPTCTCNAPAVPCTVLDPFGGSGTTAGVAIYHNRNAILCELNPEYAAMVPGRIDDVIRRMRKRAEKRAAKKQHKPDERQRSLFE